MFFKNHGRFSMSSLHMNIHWPAIQAQMIRSDSKDVEAHTGNENIFAAYSLKARPVMFIITGLGQLLDPLFTELFKSADKVAKINPNQKIVVPYETIRSKIIRFHNSLEEAFKSGETEVVARVNLTFEECLRCLNQSKEIAFKFFNQFLYLEMPFKNEEREEWKRSLSLDTLNLCYNEVGLVRSEKPISYAKEDLDFFGIRQSEKVKESTKINCADFAFLKTRERRAKDIIFFLSNFDTRRLPRLLFDWGYRVVDAPDEGDLVVYFCKGNAVHIGVFTGSGLVESKLGVLNPYSHQHRIFDVPPDYGTIVCFFRKNP